MPETHRPPEGPAILDIGADTGALLLHTSEELYEQEIHVAPVHDPDHTVHTVVRAHPLFDGRHVYAALFPALPAGDYRIVGADSATVVTIQGGQVCELDAPLMAG
jgi:hypothetical protein